MKTCEKMQMLLRSFKLTEKKDDLINLDWMIFFHFFLMAQLCEDKKILRKIPANPPYLGLLNCPCPRETRHLVVIGGLQI